MYSAGDAPGSDKKKKTKRKDLKSGEASLKDSRCDNPHRYFNACDKYPMMPERIAVFAALFCSLTQNSWNNKFPSNEA